MKTIVPGKVKGTVKAPPSKSMAQRALAAACLSEEKSRIVMGTPCDDIQSAMRAAAALGSNIESTDEGVLVQGARGDFTGEVDCGESGLCFRMFCAVASTFEVRSRLLAKGSLAVRPVDMVEKPLVALGAQCSTSKGYAPVTVSGPLIGGEIEIDATTSSQFLTGLLIALCCARGDSVIKAPGLKSKPYVQMTLDLLAMLGARIETSDNFETFHITGDQKFGGFEYDVPGDWSGASFPLVAGAIAGKVGVSGLDMTSTQADVRIIDALKLSGAHVVTEDSIVRVEHRPLKAFEFDATHCPDLFPPLAALAANCSGTSRITGVHRLAAKECDREAAIIEEFGKLGMGIHVEGDTMLVTGGPLNGGRVDSHGDHRMAMAMAVAALNSKERVQIDGDSSINKSYPDFFVDMAKLGVCVEE